MKKLFFFTAIAFLAYTEGFSQKMIAPYVVTWSNDTIQVNKLSINSFNLLPSYRDEQGKKQEPTYRDLKAFGYTDKKGNPAIYRAVPTKIKYRGADTFFLPLTISGKNCNQYHIKMEINYRKDVYISHHYYAFENKQTGKYVYFSTEITGDDLRSRFNSFFSDYPTMLTMIEDIHKKNDWTKADFQKIFEAFNGL